MAIQIIVDTPAEKIKLLENPVFKKLEKNIKIKKKKKKLPVERQILTGREVKFAAENKLPVYCELIYFSLYDKHKNVRKKCIMEKAPIGYFIASTDINPDEYKQDEYVFADFSDGTLTVRSIPGIIYK